MSDFDFILRNGTIITHERVVKLDVAVAQEKIVALGENLAGSAKEEINADGLHIFPGIIDAHVHFNEPGRADWEGIETGSQALAAGGGTLFFDMPLNAHPPTCDVESFDLEADAARAKLAHRFRALGRPRAPQSRTTRTARRAWRDCLQGVHVEQRHRGFFARGRHHVAQRDEAHRGSRPTY